MRRRAAVATTVAALAAATAGALDPPAAGAAFSCPNPPTVSYEIPSRVPFADQAPFDCFAWQQFIALNWAADTSTCAADPSVGASSFGEPGDTTPAVWETYKTPSEVFLSGAEPPAAWCAGDGAAASSPDKPLSHLNKFAAASAPLELSGFTEASPETAWLTAQNGNLTLYEIRMNQDEFAYIVQEELYDADEQQSVASGAGIQLPDDGSGVTGVGTIELKAAWLELGPDQDPSRYRTATAQVRYPGRDPETVTVGLVGLHIIHKLQVAQQMVWATFEHVDNAPDTASSDEAHTYFDPGCVPSSDPYGCAANKPPPATGAYCDGGPPPANGACYEWPMQVVRENPIPSAVATVNESAQQLIRAANGDSVFQYYQLVDVLWPDQSFTVPAGSRTPLGNGDQTATSSPPRVANTTLETYVQDLTCLDCHTGAPIAAPSAAAPVRLPGGSAPGATATTDASQPYAADYSFLLSHAQAPAVEDGLPGWAVAAFAAAGAAGLVGLGAAAARRSRRRAAR